MSEPKGYWVRIGRDEFGPKSLEGMRLAVRAGEIGRQHHVSVDGETWRNAEMFPELFQTELIPIEEVVEEPYGSSLPQVVDVGPAPVMIERDSLTGTGGVNAIGLAGFICAVAASTLLLAPLIIFFLKEESLYFLVPLSIPLTVISVVGLVLSVAGMLKHGRTFSIAGMIVGVSGALLGLITTVGWLVADSPVDGPINDLIRAAQTDIEREGIEFQFALEQYRNTAQDAGLTLEDKRNALTRTFVRLVKVYDKYVSSAAIRMTKFRTAFRQLSQLRISYDEFAEGIKAQESMAPIDALNAIGERPDTVKFLLDMITLYQNKQITIDQAQSKFRTSRVSR